jgi:beta-phosphoglucomutase-like phosphatase (HAD superfamily)
MVRLGAGPPRGVGRVTTADADLVADLVAEIDAVLFDLDGVLVDTEPWWHEVRVAWAAERGRPWREEDSRLCMGRNSREWSEIMRERLGAAETPFAIEQAIVAALVARYASEPVPLVADAPAAAARIAARVPVAIASSAHPAVIRAAIGAAGLASVFSTIVSSDDVPRGKPAPDVYLEAARRLGIAPARCLVIEDSRNGVLAGRAAGMRVVLVPNASVAPGPGVAEIADAVLERLADLPVASLGSSA